MISTHAFNLKRIRVVDQFAKNQEKQPVHKLLFLGSCESGKTTLVERIVNDDKPHARVLKQGKLFPQILVDATQFMLVDVPKGKNIQHFESAAAVVLVVDCTDYESIEESRLILMQIKDNKDLRHKPILVFGNKSDIILSVSESSLRSRLDLEKADTDPTKIEVFMTSGLKGTGYTKGLRWLAVVLQYQDDLDEIEIENYALKRAKLDQSILRLDSDEKQKQE